MGEAFWSKSCKPTGAALGRPISSFLDCEIDGLTRLATAGAIERNVIWLNSTGRSIFIQVVPLATIRVRQAPVVAEECKLLAPPKAVARGGTLGPARPEEVGTSHQYQHVDLGE